MAFFTWDDTYRIGIESIDQQHQKLFAMVSDFHEAIRQKETQRAMSELLKGLVDYAVYHFTTEEEYMKQQDYPQYERHRVQHARFGEKVAEFQSRFQAGRLLIPIEVANFLKDWLSHHVLSEDQRFGAFVTGKNQVANME